MRETSIYLDLLICILIRCWMCKVKHKGMGITELRACARQQLGAAWFRLMPLPPVCFTKNKEQPRAFFIYLFLCDTRMAPIECHVKINTGLYRNRMIPRAKLSIFWKAWQILHFCKASLDTLEKSEAVFMKCTNNCTTLKTTIKGDHQGLMLNSSPNWQNVISN
jgi:hypothetical protein